jgi:hypothetical protein
MTLDEAYKIVSADKAAKAKAKASKMLDTEDTLIRFTKALSETLNRQTRELSTVEIADLMVAVFQGDHDIFALLQRIEKRGLLPNHTHKAAPVTTKYGKMIRRNIWHAARN